MQPASKQPVAVSSLFASFMEEHSIRWGEIVGGMLIICCSIALVISFWSEIAARPLLKFFIFNSVTAVLFAIGIHADRRWQLKTTSLGILIISILLVPLNVLAIAAFTDASPPSDFLSIAGEVLSLTVFGSLTFLAARTVVPHNAFALVTGVMVPSVMQLLTRRFAHVESPLATLYLLTLTPVAGYWATSGFGLKWLANEDAVDEKTSNELFILFGLISYSTLLPLALCLFKIWQAPPVIHDMSPVLSLLAIPAVAIGIFSWRRLDSPAPVAARIAGVAIGCLGVVVIAVAIFMAWPHPATLLPTTLIPGLLFLVYAIGWKLPAAYYVASLSALIAWPLVAHVLRGTIGWRSNGAELTSSMLSAPTGNLLMPLVGVMGAATALLARRQQYDEARTVGISTGIVAAVCLGLVTWFGFGRAGDPFGVTWTFAAIAIATYVGALWVNHYGLTWAAVWMILGAVVQGTLFRWPVEGTWLVRCVTAGLIHASICLALLSLVTFFKDDSKRVQWASWQAALATSSVAALLVIATWWTEAGSDVLLYAAWVTLIWFVIALASNDPLIFAAFQIAIAATLLCVTVRSTQESMWYTAGAMPWLQSQFLQCFGLLLAAYCVIWSVFRRLLPRIDEPSIVRPAVGDPIVVAESASSTGASIPAVFGWSSLRGLDTRLGGLIHHQTSCVDHVVAGLLVAIVTWLALYSAVPGVAQELAPRDYVADSVIRVVPPIGDFEIPTVPSAAATSYVSWAVLAAAIVVVLARSRQWTPGLSKLLLLFLLGLACPLVSGRWAADVSVASGLRWALAVFFLAASVPLWLRRQVPRWLAELAVPQTSWRVWQLREVSAAQILLFAIVLVPYLLMAIYVSTSALSKSGWPAPVAGLLPALSLVAGASLFLAGGIWISGVHRSSPQENSRAKWALPAGAAISFVGLGPILVAVMFAVAAGLMKHPIVGPEPGSWFHAVGWSIAYTVPVFLIAVTFVGHAIRERSAPFAFASGVVFQIAATTGFMLALPRMGRTLDHSAWIHVAQINSIVASLVSILWLAYVTLLGRVKRAALNFPTLLTSYVLIAVSLLWVTLLPALGQLWLDPLPGQWVTVVGGWLGWLAFGLVSVAILFWGNATSGRFGMLEFGVALLSAVIMAATTIARWDNGNWLAYHATELGIMLALGIVVTARYWWNRIGGQVPLFATSQRNSTFAASPPPPDSQSATSLVTESVGWYATFALLGVMFALRGAFDDQLGHWWSVGTISLVAVAGALLAWHAQRRVLVYVAGILWSVGSSVWWLLVPLPKYAGGFIEIPIDFLHFNQVMVIVPIAFSLFYERHQLAARPRGKAAVSYHAATTILGIALFGITVLAGLGADWGRDSLDDSLWLGVGAWFVLLASAMGWYAERRRPACVPILYIVGLLGLALFQDRLDVSGPLFWWTATMLLAAYGLGTSYLWSQRANVREFCARLNPLPALGAESQPQAALVSSDEYVQARGSLGWIVAANGLLAAIVVVLVGWIDLTFETMTLRIPAAHAVLAQALSLALLAQGTTRNPLHYASLALGTFFAIVFGWSWLQPLMDATVLHHAVVMVVAIAVVVIVYGFGLVKFFRHRNDWVTAAERLVPTLVGLGGVTLLFVIGCEVQHYLRDGHVPIQGAAIVAIAIALAGICIACLLAALLPGRDPLGLSERGRQTYVYAAELVLALLGLHIRLTMPWLFQGWFVRFWPLIVMGIAFLGVGFGELMHRRRQRVLSEPLVTTGALLPVLPVLSFWIVPVEINYSLTLLAVGALYATLYAIRKSVLYAVLATVSANGSLWYLLHQIDGLDFLQHPQLWLIPPALCVLVAGHLCRRQLTESQLTGIRYAAAVVIYVASTADIFITGVANAPWLPLVLAGISIAGIFAGILLRVRAFLYLGVSFLMVSMLTIIWYAAVELERTWIWWVSGIVAGVLIIALFAVFEKRRDDMLQLVENLKTWER